MGQSIFIIIDYITGQIILLFKHTIVSMEVDPALKR